jgi:hypothetical protein
VHPRPLRAAVVCAALALATFASATASADEPPQVIDANVLAQQRQIFDQANKLYDAQKYPEAEAAYLEAWKLKRSFDVAGNLGNLEADMKKWRPAAEYLAYALREFPAGGKPDVRDKLLKRLAEVEKEVGKLLISVNRTGAEVFVDGTSVGLAPIANVVYVDPGAHVVEARLEGYPPAQAKVDAAKEATVDVAVHLEPKGANKTIIIAGGAAAGALAIIGAALTGVWASKGSSASKLAAMVPHNAPCPPDGTGATGTCADLKSALGSKATFGSAAVGMWVAASAVGVGTLVYGLAAGARGPRTSGLVVAPGAWAHGGGVLLSGSY